MPSPSKAALFTGLLVTAGIFIGGAYAASYMAEPITDAQRDFQYDDYMPSLAPGGNDVAPDTPAVPVYETKAQTNLAEYPVKETTSSQNQAVSSSQTLRQPVAQERAETGLNVTITNTRNAVGKVYVLVFADAAAYKSYDYTKAVGYAELQAGTHNLMASFPELNDGPYAVMILHDEDGNQDLTLDSQGYPAEGYGTSNAKTKYDDLSFAKAAIKPGKTSVKMHYLQ